jgi:hypothetical protein
MFGYLRSRSLTGALLIASLGGAALGGCQPSGAARETASPSPLVSAPPSPPAAVVDGGTITLTDDDCTWDDSPGSVRAGRVAIEVVNETDDYGVFEVHRLKPEFTWDDGRDAIAAINDALEAGEDWPNWATNVSTLEGEGAADARGTELASVTLAAGTIGVVCSANTSPTGDVLSVFLVGPLEVAAP